MKKLASAVMMASLLSGCTFQRELGEIAVDHNRMVADSADQVMLLNILRAQHRMPLHFSSVTTVNGDISMELGGSITPSLVQRGADTTELGASGTFTTNPSFTAAVLDNDKFQRGILKPIDTQVIAYLLDQGYPDDLIMALFIERIDLRAGPKGFPRVDYVGGEPAIVGKDYPADEIIGSIRNDASHDSSFGSFLCDYAVTTGSIEQHPQEVLRWPGTIAAWPQMFNGAELKSYPYIVEFDAPTDKRKPRSAGTYKVSAKLGDKTALRLTRVATSEGRCGARVRSGVPAHFERQNDGSNLLMGGNFAEAVSVQNNEEKAKGTGKSDGSDFVLNFGGRKYPFSMEVQPRSVEDVIYFLGEYLRKGNPYQFGNRPTADTDEPFCGPPAGGQYTLFRVAELPREASLVSVRYDDRTYAISKASQCPHVTGDRSSTVLGLVEQVLNLYKSADDLPQANTVRLIGK